MILISSLEDRTFLSKKIPYRHIRRNALALIFKLCIVMYNLNRNFCCAAPGCIFYGNRYLRKLRRGKLRFVCMQITFQEIHRDVYYRHFRKWWKSRSFKPIDVLRL